MCIIESSYKKDCIDRQPQKNQLTVRLREVSPMKKRDKCVKCGSSLLGIDARNCKECGTPVMNFCKDCDHINPDNAERCERCGEKTAYMLAGINNMWIH